jgi:hypothetical protein
MLAAERLGDEVTAKGAPGPGLVPVRWVNLPAKEAHALAAADNQLGKKETDEEKMRSLVRSGELAAEDWQTAGFAEKEIRALAFDPWPEEQAAPGRGGRGRALNYSIILECRDEPHQTELLERLELEGLTVKPWVG